jgi:hypothetical protein
LKYIFQLVDLREKLVHKMNSHIDKYDGSCTTREKLVEFLYDGMFTRRASVNPNSDDENRSETPPEDFSTDCMEGKKFNSQMEIILKTLLNLGYVDKDCDSVRGFFIHLG